MIFLPLWESDTVWARLETELTLCSWLTRRCSTTKSNHFPRNEWAAVRRGMWPRNQAGQTRGVSQLTAGRGRRVKRRNNSSAGSEASRSFYCTQYRSLETQQCKKHIVRGRGWRESLYKHRSFDEIIIHLWWISGLFNFLSLKKLL